MILFLAYRTWQFAHFPPDYQWAWKSKRRKMRTKERKREEERRGMIRSLVERAMGIELQPLPVPVAAQVKAIIAPYVASAPVPSLDVAAMIADMKTLDRLLEIARRTVAFELAEQDDEEALLLL